jgi:hypothetical protein
VTLSARWVTLRVCWVTLRARWVTLRARWVTLRARWVAFRRKHVDQWAATTIADDAEVADALLRLEQQGGEQVRASMPPPIL